MRPRPVDENAVLPALRGELQLVSEADQAAAGGVIFDPVRSRYFRIGSETVELLKLWPQCATAAELSVAAAERFGLHIDEPQIAELAAFLSANQLTLAGTESDWRRLLAVERQGDQGWLAWSIHNYLFMRIPLFAPEPLLKRVVPLLAPLYTLTAAVIAILVGVLGCYLVSRQWDGFLATFPHLFSLHGAVLFSIAIGIVKSLHELGHAVTAARYGCRIPSMGICFMVLVPMLYTDVTDAWRLQSKRQRAAIDTAGLIVEFAIACIATFTWAFLPEGIPKSVAFAFATTGWLLSFGLNLNPFMRFDGYYLACDLTGIENLQPRAFALGRWQLRELLFGLGAPPPERFSTRAMRWMVAYAWVTWIYRVVIFTGIALLVYHLAFKLLGIALFLIEVVFFIALPVWRELEEWWAMRGTIRIRRRAAITGGILAAVAMALFVPWASRIAVPAIVEDGDIEPVFPKRTAYVVKAGVARGESVERGELIAELASPELDQDIVLTRERIKLAGWRLARVAGDAADRAEMLVLQDARKSLTTRLAGLEAERAELRIVAERGGVIAERDPHLHAGRWLQRTDAIALIRSGTGEVIKGYVAEDDVGRIDIAAPARFIPDAPSGAAREVTIERVAATGTQALTLVELSSHYGGAIAARPQARGAGDGRAQVPLVGQFLITGRIEPGASQARVVRGTLFVEGRPESLAARALRQILKVLVRESGM